MGPLRRFLQPGKRRPDLDLFNLGALNKPSRSENEAVIRGLCAVAYLGNDTALCRTLGRYKMFVDTTDLGHSPHLMLDGYWEMWLTEAIAQVVRPGMACVDVGANLGYFTLLMADLAGPEGAVHAFEPNPAIAGRLLKSIDLNGFRDRVILHRELLGSQDGSEAFLRIPDGEPKNAHITADPDGAIALTVRRYDSFPELLGADVVKIDAEAAELDIWRGMTGFFQRRVKPVTIFLEFAAARYAEPGGFLDEITAHGFSLGEVTFDDGLQPRTREQILAAPPRLDQMLVLRG